MMLNKFRIALATVLALAAVSAVDSASAQLLGLLDPPKNIPLGDGIDQNDKPFRDSWPYGGPEQDSYRARRDPLGPGGRVGRR
jgi:hypothetical protein